MNTDGSELPVVTVNLPHHALIAQVAPSDGNEPDDGDEHEFYSTATKVMVLFKNEGESQHSVRFGNVIFKLKTEEEDTTYYY